MMRALSAFASGLFLSAALLLSAPLQAAELQPFFSLKTSSINSLVNAAEKIASMAELGDQAEFRFAINTIKTIQGFNFDSEIGIAVIADGNALHAVFLLPIADLRNAEIPSNPEIFGSIRPFLIPRGADRTEIPSPLGTFIALQKQGYLVIAPEEIVGQLPENPKTLIADLEKYTIGTKLDLEKVRFETLEATLFGPMLFMMAMQNPEMAEQLENVVEVYRAAYNEISVLSYGIVFNSQTADFELSYSVIPRAGSDSAKSVAEYKQQPTIFGGFRGTPGNTVFSIGDSATYGKIDLANSAIWTASMKQHEAMVEGLLEQIEMDDETGQSSELAKKIIDSLYKIYMTEASRGGYHKALSLNTDGTFLLAFETVSLAEIRSVAADVVSFAAQRLSGETTALIESSIGYATVEGFEVSKVSIPIIPSLETIFGPAPDDIPASFRALKLNVFWAIKPGDTQAVAFAAGIDAAKAEQAFRTALGQTRTAVPVQKPVGTLSLQGLGKFLQQTVEPLVDDAVAASVDSPPSDEDLAVIRAFKQVASVFVAAEGADMTMDYDITPERTDVVLGVSGRAIQAIVTAIKTAVEGVADLHPAMRDF
ncbi:MAG: hypothetical protein FWG73_04360 [Planctomycetaceae bacterium]|nr:hypothetical protein [Planctomycetaceae bacterium]